MAGVTVTGLGREMLVGGARVRWMWLSASIALGLLCRRRAGEGGTEQESETGEFVLLRQFIHTENSDDILKRLVILEDLLDGGGDLVMFLSDLENQKGSIEYMTSS